VTAEQRPVNLHQRVIEIPFYGNAVYARHEISKFREYERNRGNGIKISDETRNGLAIFVVKPNQPDAKRSGRDMRRGDYPPEPHVPVRRNYEAG
jgi:hypothetical protein